MEVIDIETGLRSCAGPSTAIAHDEITSATTFAASTPTGATAIPVTSTNAVVPSQFSIASSVASAAANPADDATTVPATKRAWPAARRVRMSARLSTLASEASLPISGFGELVALARFAARAKNNNSTFPLDDESSTHSEISRARSTVSAEASPWSLFENQMDEDAENRNIGAVAGAVLPITMSKVNVLTGEARPKRHIWAEWIVLLSLFSGLVVYRQKDRIWGADAPLQPWVTPAFSGSMAVAFLGWLLLLWKNINWHLARTLASTMKIWTTMAMGVVIFVLEVCYPRTSLSPFAGGGAAMVLLMLLSLDAVQDKSRRFALYIGFTVILAFGYNLGVLMFADDDAGIVLGSVSGREFTKQDVKANLFTNILLLIAGGLGTLFNDRKQELLMFINQPLKKADVEAAYAEEEAMRKRARSEERRRERSLFSQKSPNDSRPPRPSRRRSLTASTKKVLNAIAQAIAEALV